MCGCAGNSNAAPVPGSVVTTESTTAGAGLIATRTAAAVVAFDGGAAVMAASAPPVGGTWNSLAWVIVGGIVLGMLIKHKKVI